MGTRHHIDGLTASRCGGGIVLGFRGACVAGLLLGAGLVAQAQNLSYDTEREMGVPEYATLRVGPLYSTFTFYTAASYRYTRSSGAGTDYIYSGNRGRIREDGSDFPILVAVDARNYVPISRHSAMDISVRVAYRYFPLETQDNEWSISTPDERVTANFSTTYRLSPVLNGVIYDRMEYVTDYVDLRGRQDDYGGQQYTYFQNEVGNTLRWGLSPTSGLTLDLSRVDLFVLDNEDQFGNQERYEYRESLGYERRFLEKIIAGARVRYTQRFYKDPTRADTTQQDYDIYVGGDNGGGIPLTEATTLSLRLGTSVGSADSTAAEEASNQTVLTGGATLRTQLSKELSHAISYDRGLRSGFNTAFEEYSIWRYQVDWDRVGNHISFFSYYDTVSPSANDLNTYNAWITGVAINYPLLTWLTLDTSYQYVRTDNSGSANLDPNSEAANPELVDDYYARVARIGTTLSLLRDIKFITYVERYERLSDVSTLEFTRDTFEATLAYSHQF